MLALYHLLKQLNGAEVSSVGREAEARRSAGPGRHNGQTVEGHLPSQHSPLDAHTLHVVVFILLVSRRPVVGRHLLGKGEHRFRSEGTSPGQHSRHRSHRSHRSREAAQVPRGRTNHGRRHRSQKEAQVTGGRTGHGRRHRSREEARVPGGRTNHGRRHRSRKEAQVTGGHTGHGRRHRSREEARVPGGGVDRRRRDTGSQGPGVPVGNRQSGGFRQLAVRRMFAGTAAAPINFQIIRSGHIIG